MVGLVKLAMHSNSEVHCIEQRRKRQSRAYRHLGGMQAVPLWFVELSWGSVGGDGAAP